MKNKIEDIIQSNDFGEDIQIVCLNQEEESNYGKEIEDADGILVWHGKMTSYTLKRLSKWGLEDRLHLQQ